MVNRNNEVKNRWSRNKIKRWLVCHLVDFFMVTVFAENFADFISVTNTNG